MTSFAPSSFARHIELKMAAILGCKPWQPKTFFSKYWHAISYFVGSFMLIQNHIIVTDQKCTGKKL